MTATSYVVIRDFLDGRLTQGATESSSYSSTSSGGTSEEGGDGQHRDAGDDDKARAGSQAVATRAALDVQGSAASSAGTGDSRLSWGRKISLFCMIQVDTFSAAEVALVAYGLVPVALAAWSLLRNGPKFEYIV